MEPSLRSEWEGTRGTLLKGLLKALKSCKFPKLPFVEGLLVVLWVSRPPLEPKSLPLPIFCFSHYFVKERKAELLVVVLLKPEA